VSGSKFFAEKLPHTGIGSGIGEIFYAINNTVKATATAPKGVFLIKAFLTYIISW
jgi:hypothetical protein